MARVQELLYYSISLRCFHRFHAFLFKVIFKSYIWRLNRLNVLNRGGGGGGGGAGGKGGRCGGGFSGSFK
jgi:uncharacterized membrane protein YgcG